MTFSSPPPRPISHIASGAILTVDLGAIRSNYRLLRQQAGSAECGAVMKADAYGLGAARIAPVLAQEGCRHFFVAHVEEGILLRTVLPHDAVIIVMHGLPAGSERDCLEHRLVPVLNSLAQIKSWATLAQVLSKKLPAVIQFDTGMARMGLSPDEVDILLSHRDNLAPFEVLFLMSHLACAEARDNPMNARQLARFEELRGWFPPLRASLANSSGIFLGPAYQFDLVRPGAALYGLAPIAGQANPMAPVVSLQGKILQTRSIEDGDTVGYGMTWRARGRREIATIAVGYADGWLRALGNRGVVLVDGVSAPIVGAVSMDTITVDVTGIAAERLLPGALLDLISSAQPADAVAALAGTIGYEILTSLGQRYHRHYLDVRKTDSL
ncbi:MAG: alanine racemase [Janthinobacterium lividum]